MITLYFVGFLLYLFCVMKFVNFIWNRYDSELIGGFAFLFLMVTPITMIMDFVYDVS